MMMMKMMMIMLMNMNIMNMIKAWFGFCKQSNWLVIAN